MANCLLLSATLLRLARVVQLIVIGSLCSINCIYIYGYLQIVHALNISHAPMYAFTFLFFSEVNHNEHIKQEMIHLHLSKYDS